nr:retrovirus-related Pol polyprotein from transposon TNT 1-94 [Tanacetum cinerariifolium]
MSTQQDIYAAGSKNRPPMLNKENYVPWSSRLLRYAISKPNGKLIHNSIINGPYVRRMILEPGDTNRKVLVNETFHVQTDDELTEKELKQIEADDQAIQTILLGLPKDIYAAVDSCETAQEIWLRVQQMMKGSDIRIQVNKAKLFNEWERFTSNDGESIKSYYHCFLKLMNDLKRNKHFPEKIASNLKFVNNLQPKWSRHVTIVHQTKDLHTADYTQLYDFLKYNQNDVDELKAERLAKTQDPLALMANSNNPYAFPAPHQDQPSFNQNYMQQPMPNPEDITDLTTAMNMALALMAKAFKLNYSTPTNNNQRISSNPRNKQIAQPGMNMGQDRQMQMVEGNGENQFRQYTGQNVRNLNGYNVVQNVKNQNGNGNLVAVRAEGNATGHNGNQIRCYNCKGEEAGIQLQAEEFDLMAAAADLDEIEKVNANCILMANLQQTSTSGTQTDKAPVYDSDGSTEVHNNENCHDNEIFNMFTQEEQYTELLEPIPEPHQVPQNDNNVISEVFSVEHSGGTVEQHPKNIEETRALYDSLYQNLAIEVEKVNMVNRKLKETNAELTTELARFKNQEKCFEISQEKYDKLERCYQKSVYQEQCVSKKINALHLSSGKQIMTLNEDISDLNKQLSKEKSTVSFLLEEKKKLKSDFKIREDELLDKQIQLEKMIKELDNILVKTGQSIQTIHMLSPKPDLFYHTEQKMALCYQNPFYLKQAQKKQQSLYDEKVLLENHDPPIVDDLEETLQLAQENISQTANVSKPISTPNEEFSDDTTPSVARKFLNEALELEIERLLRAVVSQDIMSVMQKAFVVDTSNLQTELERTKERVENCIIKKENEYAKLWNDWYKKCEECKFDKISYDKAYKDMQQKIERSQAQLGDLKGKSKDTSCVSDTLNPLSQKLENENVELEFQVLNYAKENAHLKTTYKNLFDSISVSRTQTKTIIASLKNKLQNTIYENAKLRAQLFNKVSDQNDNKRGTSANTKFAKQSIMGNLPTLGETHALSKPVTSNSIPIPQKSKVMKNDKVITPGMFRIHPFKTFREEKHVPNNVTASVRTKPITVSQPPVFTKKDVNSDSNGLSSTGIDNTKTRRPQPRSNTKNDRVPSMSTSSCHKNKGVEVEEHYRNLLLSRNKKHMSSACNNIKLDSHNVISKVICAMCKQCLVSVNHDVCLCNYVNDMNSRGKKQTANVSIKEKQKKRKPKVKKPKKVGFIERLATPKPSKPRSFLRWSPTGRMFDLKGKIIASSESESQSDCSKGDNACTSNPLEPTIKRFLNSTFSLAGQFCYSDLEVAFRRSACFVRNLEGVDLLKGDHSTNLYTINLHDMDSASPTCLMARASSTKSWLWHQRLSHLNFDTINDLAKNDLVSGLPKFKYHKEHLCPSCEQGKSKRASHPPKPVPNYRQRLHLLHMDLCGPMRIANINGKRYVLVIMDDYSRYTWVHFLRSKYEAPEVIKTFLKRISILLQSPVIIIRIDNGTEFKNQVLKEYFDSIGISHQVSSVRTPQHNGVVEHRNRTDCYCVFTQNRSIIHRRFNKTPYELINGRKPDIFFLYVFGALCYPNNDREDIGRLGAKSDIGFFIGYSADSCAYRIYNRRTKKIMETFDELSTMAFEQRSSKPRLQSMTSGQITMYDDFIGGQPSATQRTVLAAQAQQVRQTSTTSTSIAKTAPTPTNSSPQATNFPKTSQDVDDLRTQQQHAQQQGNQVHLQSETIAENVPNTMFDGNTFVNPFANLSTSAAELSSSQNNVKEAMTDPAWIESMQEELLQFKRLDVWVLVPAPDNISPSRERVPPRGRNQFRRILRSGTIDPTLFIRRFHDDILVDFGFELTGFSDADYAGCKDTFKSTSGGA